MEPHRNTRQTGRDVFRVEIVCQQHSSWQGRLYWVNEDKWQNFRSALELLMLMNSAVDTRAEPCYRAFSDGSGGPDIFPDTVTAT